jgi:hypothetical protein
MLNLLKDTKPLAFERPKGIVDVYVNGKKDIAVSGVTPQNLVRAKRDRDKFVSYDGFPTIASQSAATY